VGNGWSEGAASPVSRLTYRYYVIAKKSPKRMGVFGVEQYCNRARDSDWSISETLVEKVVEAGWLAT